MSDYAGSLNLNNRKKPVGEYKEGSLKGGIKRNQLSEKSMLIFDAINNKDAQNGNVDDILDANEMQNFWNKLCQYAKDDTLGGREAKKFIKELGLKDIKKEDLYAFVKEIYGESENIESSLVDENDGTIIINYKEDKEGKSVQERIHTDKTSEVETKDADETITTKFLNADSKLTKLTVEEDNKYSETAYDADSKPASTKIVQGTKTSNYVYQDDKPVLTNTIEDLGNDLKRTTNYEWTENGHIEHIQEPEKNIVKTVTNFTTSDDKVVPLTTQEVITQGTTTTTNLYDYNQNLKQETIAEENGNQTQNIYRMTPNEEECGIDYAKLQQTKVIDGKTYQVQYDGEGNTCGIIVQFDNKELSISRFCEKFNIQDEAKFKEINSLKPNQKRLTAGQEVKIPKELEADAKILQGRDSKETVLAKQQRYNAEQERRRQLKALGWDGTSFRQGEKIKYNGKTYTILGRKTNRERLLVMDSKGRVTTASHDNKVLKDEYVATTDYYDFNPKVEISGKKYVKAPKEYNNVDGHRDNYGRDVMIDYNGSFQVASGSIDLQRQDGKRYILSQDYLYVSDQVVAGTANKRNCYGTDNIVSVVSPQGKTYYFNGVQQQDSNVVETKIADAVYTDVRNASDGIGTKKDKLRAAVGGIHNQSVLAKVNDKFKGSEFDKNNGYTALENQILDEESHGNAQKYYFQVMINNGAYDAKNTARIARQEINHELNGYKSTGSVKRVMGLINTPEARRALENTYNYNIVTELKNDGWNDIETKAFQAEWVKNNAYEMATLKLDIDGKPMLDKDGKPIYSNEGDQAIRNEVIGDLISSDDNEYFQLGLDAINTDGLVKNGPTADYLFFENKAAELCTQHEYKKQYEYQTAGQQLIAGRATDGDVVDSDDVRTFNTKLFNDEKPAEADAAPLIYEIRQGNFEHVFESTNPAVYEELNIQLVCGELDGYSNLREVYKKALENADGNNEKTKITLSAAATGQEILKDEEIVAACVSAMRMLDNEYKTGNHRAEAALIDNQLKKIIENRPDLKDNLLKHIKKSGDTLTRTTYVAFGDDVKRNRSAHWTAYVNDAAQNAIHKSDEQVFLDEQGIPITDSAQLQGLIERNNSVVDNLEIYLAHLEREFNISADEEGSITNAGRFLGKSNVDMHSAGTYKDDMTVIYTQAKSMLPKLRLAATGQLRNSKGEIVSFKDLLEPFKQQLDRTAQKNNDFVVTGEYAKMGTILAPVILTTVAASGGAASLGWGTLATAGVAGGTTFVTEYGLNTIEGMTSQNGLTKEKNAENLWRAVTDSALVASGVKYTDAIMKIKLVNPAITNITKLTSVVATDTAAGAVGEYLLTGDVTIEGMTYNAIFSATGNLIALKSARKSASEKTATSASEVVNDTPVVSKRNNLDIATSDGSAPSGGKFNQRKFNDAVIDIQTEVAAGVTPERHAQLLAEARTHQGSGAGTRAQGKTFKHAIEDGTGVYTGKKADIDLNTETDISKIQQFRRKVEGWADGERKVAALEHCDRRLAELQASPDLVGTQSKSAVLEAINEDLVRKSDALLAHADAKGRNFRIGDSDASVIIERINKTGSLDELDGIVSGINRRRMGGTKQSLIDDMMKAVESRRLQLRPEIDMDGFGTLMSSKNRTGKGFGEGEVFDVVRLIEKSSDAEFVEIEKALTSSNKNIKRNKQIRNALDTRKSRIETARTTEHSIVHTEEPNYIIRETETTGTQTKSEFLEQQFNNKLQESDIWHTAGKQTSVSRLNGQKLGKYTTEFEELCRFATTSEQLDQLQVIASKFKGQAESTSFNASIAKRRVELNGRSAAEIRVNDHEILTDVPRINNEGIPVIEITNKPARIQERKSPLELDTPNVRTRDNSDASVIIERINKTGSLDELEQIVEPVVVEKTPVVKDKPLNTSVHQTSLTADGQLKPGEIRVETTSNGNRVEVSMDEHGNLIRKTIDPATYDAVKVEMIDTYGIPTVIEQKPDISAAGLKERLGNINFDENPVNGTIVYQQDGKKYQIHYDADGNIKALRIRDLQTNDKLYFEYDTQGVQKPVDRNRFIELKATTKSLNNKKFGLQVDEPRQPAIKEPLHTNEPTLKKEYSGKDANGNTVEVYSDNAGNVIEHTLDADGNIIKHIVRDQDGSIIEFNKYTP